MSELPRDPIHGPAAPLPLADGERLLGAWVADRAMYWRGHAVMALAGGVAAGVVLVWLGNPDPWVGPVAAVAALGARGAYLASEALALSWRLTDRRLLGPGGRSIGLAEIDTAKRFFGDVQIVTRSGDKHLMKYMADAAAVVAAIEAARSGKAKR
ncbi:hypothetical protein RNZ50_19175 [Paracoccaceae bacterium Fryx2]|nr:hypothetical protein [Paracoccaceae bacterium Fryx2]